MNQYQLYSKQLTVKGYTMESVREREEMEEEFNLIQMEIFINKASLNQTGYGRLSNPYGANYKLPGKDTVKLEDPGDEFDFDKGQNGSCPKC